MPVYAGMVILGWLAVLIGAILAPLRPVRAGITPQTLVYFGFEGSPGSQLPAGLADDTASVTFSADWGAVMYGSANPFYYPAGTSADFSGGGYYRRDPGPGDVLDLTGASYTIEMFFRADTIGQAVLIRKYRPWYVDLRPDGSIHFVHNEEDISSAAGAVEPARWYHVAAVFDSSDGAEPMKLYLDGVESASGGTSQANPDLNEYPVGIGLIKRADDSNGQFFDGAVDELRVSGAALVPGQFLLSAASGPALAFELEASSAAESGGPARLRVVLSQAADADVTVDYAVAGGTAGGGDYLLVGPAWFDFDGDGLVDWADLGDFAALWLAQPPASRADENSDGCVDFGDFAVLARQWFERAYTDGRLRLAAGRTAGTIYLAIVDDQFEEQDETVVVGLSDPAGGAALRQPSRHTYTIVDNDRLPSVSFASASSSGIENIGMVFIEVVLSNAYTGTAAVDYSISGTASGGGQDYQLDPATLTFSPGQTVSYIVPRIRDDLENEQNETIVLSLSNPVNAGLGTAAGHTYTIFDNEGGVWFDRMDWYCSDSGSDVEQSSDGHFVDWNVRQGEQLIVRLPQQRFSSIGDTAVCQLLWSSSGPTDDGCQCYFDYDPDPNRYSYCTDLTCVGGTGDFRVGLFDSNGQGYITGHGMGTDNGIFSGYLGYHFRVFPHVPQDAPARFTELKDDGTAESHTNTSLWERVNAAGDSVLLSNSNSWNRLDSPMTGGFGMPVGGSAVVTMTLYRISPTQAKLEINCNGKTWTKYSEASNVIPDKIDVLAIWSNSKNYDYLRLSEPMP